GSARRRECTPHEENLGATPPVPAEDQDRRGGRGIEPVGPPAGAAARDHLAPFPGSRQPAAALDTVEPWHRSSPPGPRDTPTPGATPDQQPVQGRGRPAVSPKYTVGLGRGRAGVDGERSVVGPLPNGVSGGGASAGRVRGEAAGQ